MTATRDPVDTALIERILGEYREMPGLALTLSQHLQENPARGIDMPTLRCVRRKWVLTTAQAVSLLTALTPLARTMVGLAILSGLRRGELFALRWKHIDEHARMLTVREAVYDGTFGTPKTDAGSRQIPLSESALQLLVEWKALAKSTNDEALVFARRGNSHFAEQCAAPIDLSSLRSTGTDACDVAHLPAYLFLVVAR